MGLFVLFLALSLAPSCSRTVVGGYTDSPDKKYRLYGRVYGGYGRSFLESPTKTVRVSIVRAGANETLLLRREYPVNGFDVGWEAMWNGHEKVSVVIFDYGPGVQFRGPKKEEPQRKDIRTVTYRYDSKADSFTEESSK